MTTEHRPDSDLRVMEIPMNKRGLGEGYWLRWPELRVWLLVHDARELADEIEEQILNGEDVLPRNVVTV